MSASHDPLVCAVDVGTSAVRAALMDTRGRVVAHERVTRAGTGHAVSFDPEQMWHEVASVLARLDAAARARAAALAIAAHVGTVLVGEHGTVLHAGGWGDGAGIEQLARRWSSAPERLRGAGRPAITGGAAAALVRSAAPEPARDTAPAERVRHVLSPKDYVVWRLSDAIATDATTAAYTLLSDVRARAWSSEAAASVGVALEALPTQHDATAVVGTVGAEAARATGLQEGVPIAAGGPDGTVGALALIGVRGDAIADVSGTTDVLVALADAPPADGDRAVINPYLAGGLWARGGPTGFTGGAVAHWSRLVGAGEVAAMGPEQAARLAAISPGADGLSLVPYLNGSRFPDWDAAERGALWGMTEAHGPLHVVRAAQEAAGYVVRSGIEALAADRDELRDAELTIGGGAARSAELVQLRADVLGRPVRACADAEVTLRGAAMIAAVAGGLHRGLDDAHRMMAAELATAKPDRARRVRYDVLYAAWQRHRGHGPAANDQ